MLRGSEWSDRGELRRNSKWRLSGAWVLGLAWVLLVCVGCQKGRVERKGELASVEPRLEWSWVKLDDRGYPSTEVQPWDMWVGPHRGPLHFAEIQSLGIRVEVKSEPQEPQSERALVSLRFSHVRNCGVSPCESRFIRERARHDPESGMWWIPLGEVFSGMENNLSSIRPERLELEVLLRGGALLHQVLEIPIEGAFPRDFFREAGVQELASGPLERAKVLAREGWVVARDEFRNTTDRAIRIAWKTLRSGQFIQRVKTLYRDTFCDAVTSPKKVDLHPSLSQVGMSLEEIRVLSQRSGVSGRQSEPVSSGWRHQIVHPGESVTLEWLVRPAALTPRCVLFTERKEKVCTDGFMVRPLAFESYWWIAGWEVSGAGMREIRAADAQVSTEQMESEEAALQSHGAVQILSRSEIRRSESAGDLAGISEQFICQGVFE